MKLVLAIWLAFLIRGAFYCQFIPIWEGYDEWGHYALIEHLRLHSGELPRTSDVVTGEIRDSVLSARFRHEATEPLHVFEAQQPPLYSWILSVPNRLWIHSPIATRIRRLRLLSVLIASLVIPLGYLAALQLFFSRALALSVCVLIAAIPELMIDIARIGNESLSIALGSWIVLLLLRKRAPTLGIALGAALLTKAYFLIFVPILIIRRRFYSLFAALAMSGWWYWRNFHLTGTWTGEVMDVGANKLAWTAKLAAIGKVHWLSALDAGGWTHIWNGAWSFLAAKSWMYRVLEIILAIAAIALVRTLAKRPWGRSKHKLSLLVAAELLFAAGISYQTLLIFLNKGLSFFPGWYFYALIVPEALLITSGLLILAGRRRILAAAGFLITLFAALDLYTVNIVLARYYTASLAGVLWIAYLLATLALMVFALRPKLFAA
jgi:hypothetical protein